MDETERQYHEVAQIFPLMQGQEFEELKADIKANGLIDPIWIDRDGKIIDGRNRHRACIETETPLKFRTYTNGQSLVSFVISLNLKRRHLTSEQRAVLAQRVMPMLEAEAKERQIRKPADSVTQIIEEQKGESAEQAAKLFNTNRQYVADAKFVNENKPELLEKVMNQEMKLRDARREIVGDQKKGVPQLPNDKYRIVYADPPWRYGNTQPDYHYVQDDHYPTMSLNELIAMPIKNIVEDNAVLFLWTTSPMLEDTFRIIHAWGFEYKTSFVWDKVKHNMGHYNSVRHEFMLVCTRGACVPDTPKLFDSVITEERTEHSKKPAIFREMIDILYTYGKRIELFAREKVENWESYGNEI